MTQDQVTQLTNILISIVVGGLLPFGAEYLNRLWKLDGQKALAVAGAISAVLAVAVLAAVGYLTGTLATTFQPNNVLPAFLAVWGTGQAVFAVLKDRLGWTTKPPVATDAVG